MNRKQVRKVLNSLLIVRPGGASDAGQIFGAYGVNQLKALRDAVCEVKLA